MSKEALEAFLATSDNWAAFFILLVVLGVGGEFVVHLMQSRANKKLVALQHSETEAQEAEIARLNKDASDAKGAQQRVEIELANAQAKLEGERITRLQLQRSVLHR